MKLSSLNVEAGRCERIMLMWHWIYVILHKPLKHSRVIIDGLKKLVEEVEGKIKLVGCDNDGTILKN